MSEQSDPLLATFEWIRGYLLIGDASGNAALVDHSDGSNELPPSVYRTRLDDEDGLTLELHVVEIDFDARPAVVLGGVRLASADFYFNLVDQAQITLFLNLEDKTCGGDNGPLYKSASAVFSPSGADFTGAVTKLCSGRHGAFAWTGKGV